MNKNIMFAFIIKPVSLFLDRSYYLFVNCYSSKKLFKTCPTSFIDIRKGITNCDFLRKILFMVYWAKNQLREKYFVNIII